jgi:hypothetical protein
MKFEELVKQLANRVNQPHVIEHYLKMVWNTAVKETEKKQCTIHSVSERFYCEIETNPAQQKCKEQCNHCKEEWEKMISN